MGNGVAIALARRLLGLSVSAGLGIGHGWLVATIAQ